MQITPLIIFIVAITLVAGKIRIAILFNQQVKKLFAQPKSISGKAFGYQQLEGLPEPVRRYFKHVLQEGQPYFSYVQLKQNGHFKPGLEKAWVNIKGKQYFTTEKPGFIWKGETALFTASDSYMNRKGRYARFTIKTISYNNTAES